MTIMHDGAVLALSNWLHQLVALVAYGQGETKYIAVTINALHTLFEARY